MNIQNILIRLFQLIILSVPLVIIAIVIAIYWNDRDIEKTVTKATNVYQYENLLGDPTSIIQAGEKCIFGEESGESKAYVHIKVKCNNIDGWVMGVKNSSPTFP